MYGWISAEMAELNSSTLIFSVQRHWSLSIRRKLEWTESIFGSAIPKFLARLEMSILYLVILDIFSSLGSIEAQIPSARQE